jgi:hypothetical protein
VHDSLKNELLIMASQTKALYIVQPKDSYNVKILRCDGNSQALAALADFEDYLIAAATTPTGGELYTSTRPPGGCQMNGMEQTREGEPHPSAPLACTPSHGVSSSV